MKLRSWLVAIFLLLFLTGPVNADSRAEILAVMNYYADMWNQGDVDALQGYYHQDFVLVTDDGIVHRGQLIDDIGALGQSGGQRGELDFSKLEVRLLGDGNAVAYGITGLKFDDGSSIDNWFSTIYEKTPFGWKAVLTRN
jgi:ketosteroid isomerase-like protein